MIEYLFLWIIYKIYIEHELGIPKGKSATVMEKNMKAARVDSAWYWKAITTFSKKIVMYFKFNTSCISNFTILLKSDKKRRNSQNLPALFQDCDSFRKTFQMFISITIQFGVGSNKSRKSRQMHFFFSSQNNENVCTCKQNHKEKAIQMSKTFVCQLFRNSWSGNLNLNGIGWNDLQFEPSFLATPFPQEESMFFFVKMKTEISQLWSA